MKKGFVLIAFAFAACTGRHDTTGQGDYAAAIDAASLAGYIKTLSGDDFMGRKPFTRGDSLTVAYISDEFKRLGLVAGNDGSYFQEVPMVEITSTPTMPLSFHGGASQLNLEVLEDYVIGSQGNEDHIDIAGSGVVFAGFGIVAPEYGWNDYEGLDATGKTVVVMVNDPGFYDKQLFKGDTMTYYGRWTYKFEEAARQGATGVLIIHDDKAASYGWNVVRSGWTGPKLSLQTDGHSMPLTRFEGWITAESATRLMEIAGSSEDLIDRAKKTGFKPVELPLTASVSLRNQFRKSASNNVLGKIEGSANPDQYIIYTAHWDHLGIGEPVAGDSIYNGAIDNATGVASLFELAKAFKAAGSAPKRSILFLAVTAEEQGLLGSAYYASNPVYPLSKTVANINIDALSPIGKTRDISVIGLGHSELDEYAIRAAARQQRVVVPGGNPSAGSFFRSDHFNFAKMGVPALYTGGGKEVIGMDSSQATHARDAIRKRYHHVTDEYNDSWDLSGIVADIQLVFDVGYALSQENTFPKWKAGSAFEAIGEKRF